MLISNREEGWRGLGALFQRMTVWQVDNRRLRHCCMASQGCCANFIVATQLHKHACMKAAGRLPSLCAMQLYLEVNDSSLLLHILLFLSSLALFGCSSRLCFDFIIISLAIYSILTSAQVLGHTTAIPQQNQIFTLDSHSNNACGECSICVGCYMTVA